MSLTDLNVGADPTTESSAWRELRTNSCRQLVLAAILFDHCSGQNSINAGTAVRTITTDSGSPRRG